MPESIERERLDAAANLVAAMYYAPTTHPWWKEAGGGVILAYDRACRIFGIGRLGNWPGLGTRRDGVAAETDPIRMEGSPYRSPASLGVERCPDRSPTTDAWCVLPLNHIEGHLGNSPTDRWTE
jgi:hypothetical protein